MRYVTIDEAPVQAVKEMCYFTEIKDGEEEKLI